MARSSTRHGREIHRLDSALESSSDHGEYNDWTNSGIEGLPPVIETQPEDLTVEVPTGGTFSIVASHPRGAVLYYLWQANDGGGWVDADTALSDASGGTTPVLTLGSTVAGDDGHQIRCRVRAYADNNQNQINSATVDLTVTTP